MDELLDLAIGELEDELAALKLRPLVTRRVKKEWATLKEGAGAAPPPHSYAQPMYAQLQAQQPVVTVTAQPIAILQPCAQQFMYAQPQIVQQQQTDVSVNGAGVPGGPSPSPPAILPVFQYTCSSARLGVWSAEAWVFTSPGVQSVHGASLTPLFLISPCRRPGHGRAL